MMDSFTQFNLLEGIYWVFLGAVALILFRLPRVSQKYKKILLAASITLFLFGISDFVEIKTLGFLGPDAWWLFAWKAAALGVLLVIAIWFFRVWLKRNT